MAKDHSQPPKVPGKMNTIFAGTLGSMATAIGATGLFSAVTNNRVMDALRFTSDSPLFDRIVIGVGAATVTAIGVATIRAANHSKNAHKHEEYKQTFQEKINAERKMAEMQHSGPSL